MNPGRHRCLREFFDFRRRHVLYVQLPLAAALVSVAMPASAQQTSAGQLDNIIVTAQRRVEVLQDVPLSIQALSTETLE